MKKDCCKSRISAKGFTLMEVLVAVIIMGVLAAIAVPQYQKAVTKSKAAKLQIMLAEVVRASDAFYLQYRRYPKTFEELDLKFKLPTVPAKQSVCGKDLLPSGVKQGEDFQLVIYGGNNSSLIHNVISAHFTTGKYKCRGFVHYQISKTAPDLLNKHTFCGEHYYNRNCGTNCEGGIFCNQVMGKTWKRYAQLIHVYE